VISTTACRCADPSARRSARSATCSRSTSCRSCRRRARRAAATRAARSRSPGTRARRSPPALRAAPSAVRCGIPAPDRGGRKSSTLGSPSCAKRAVARAANAAATARRWSMGRTAGGLGLVSTIILAAPSHLARVGRASACLGSVGALA
jgi:hypothetical protein